MSIVVDLSPEDTAALRELAEREQQSVEEVVSQAVRQYVETREHAERLDQVLDQELPRYAEALERLGQ